MWDLEALKAGVNYLNEILGKRFNDVKGFEPDVNYIIKSLDEDYARKSLVEFFGSGRYKAVGLDGSMDYKVGLDIVTIFIAVASYSLPFEISSDGDIILSFNNVEKIDSMSIFKVIPFWFDDLNGLTDSSNLLDDRSISKGLDSIPNSIMTLGEYYSAFKALEDEDVKIVFLDRPIASSIGPYKRDARKVIYRYGGGIFTSEGINGKKISLIDLILAVYLGPDPNFYDYEFRPGTKKHYILQLVANMAWESRDTYIKYSELIPKLPIKISRDKVVKVLDKLNREFFGGRFIEDYLVDGFIVTDRIYRYWDSIEAVLEIFIDKLFDKGGYYSHPLYVGGRPLTTKEINMISLFLIYKIKWLIDRNHKLVIGIGKDTSVTDMNRSLLPYLSSKGYIKNFNFRAVRSDRSMFIILSSLHRELFPVPWRSIGYDNIFSTLVYRDGVLTPARKVTTLSKFLIRNYFQLREVKSLDAYVRSPIFFYDRFYREDRDRDLVRGVDIKHVDKHYKSYIYLETGLNPYDNMILYILSKFDNDQIIESAGHNYLLFIADKEVKRMIKTVKTSVSNVVENTLYRMIRQHNIYVLTKSFREYRAQIERWRR